MIRVDAFETRPVRTKAGARPTRELTMTVTLTVDEAGVDRVLDVLRDIDPAESGRVHPVTPG